MAVRTIFLLGQLEAVYFGAVLLMLPLVLVTVSILDRY